MVEPSQRAVDMAHRMLGDEGIHRAVLQETLDSARQEITESGRTFCNGNEPKAPQRRRNRSVELAGCSPGVPAGVMHSHISEKELRNPQHSLPDMANVVFTNSVACSVVIGTESADVMYEPYRDATEEFQNAIGLEAESTSDIINALKDKRITSPSEARNRVRSALPGLFETHSTGYSDLNGIIESQDVPQREPVDSHFVFYEPESKSMISKNLNSMRERRERNKHIVVDIAKQYANPIDLMMGSLLA